MKTGRILATVAIALGFVFAGATTAFAYYDECPDSYDGFHDWEEVNDTYHRCAYCGAEDGHDEYIFQETPATCTEQQTTAYTCRNCSYLRVEYGRYEPHNWEYGWLEKKYNSNDYVYKKWCRNEDCDAERIVKKTVKKKKYRRILPKSFLKGAKKVHLSYNKKKVKVTKKGKVKGKKRRATAKIVWDVKYKNHRGRTWWESYTVYVKVK